MEKTFFLRDKELLESTCVDNIFISSLMPQAPEIAVKTYLYGLMLLSSSAHDEDIAAVLGCEQSDIRSAFAYWESVGIVKVIAEEPLRVMYLNIKTSLSKGRINMDGAVYGDFVRRLQEVLGTRMLSGAELSKIYDWLDVFGFEQDAALEIVRHCLDKKGARTAVAYMDAMARNLAGRGFITYDAVREYFVTEEIIKSGAARILKRWNKRRLPTDDEIALYEKWIEGWGFDEDGIDAACACMTAAEKPTFKYLDSVLEEWHSNGSIDRASIDAMQKQDDILIELARKAFSRAGLKSRANAEQRLQFRQWSVDWCMSDDMILLAADYSRLSTKQFASMKRLLNEWHDRGISSAAEAEVYYNGSRKSAARTNRKDNRALKYIHGRQYNDEELKKLGISMGEEFYDDDD